MNYYQVMNLFFAIGKHEAFKLGTFFLLNIFKVHYSPLYSLLLFVHSLQLISDKPVDAKR